MFFSLNCLFLLSFIKCFFIFLPVFISVRRYGLPVSISPSAHACGWSDAGRSEAGLDYFADRCLARSDNRLPAGGQTCRSSGLERENIHRTLPPSHDSDRLFSIGCALLAPPSRSRRREDRAASRATTDPEVFVRSGRRDGASGAQPGLLDVLQLDQREPSLRYTVEELQLRLQFQRAETIVPGSARRGGMDEFSEFRRRFREQG